MTAMATPLSSLTRPAADPGAALRVHGVASLGPALDAAALATARAAFAEVLDQAVTGGYAQIVHDAWRKAPALAALVPRLGRLACAATGLPEVVLFHDHLLNKLPDGEDMAWHQDYSYLPLDRPDGVTLWVALDDVTEANGCLFYLPGTHTAGELRAAWGMYGDDDPRAALPPIAVPPDEPGLAAPTPAGGAVVHDTLVLHRSPKNRTAAPRRAWALSFVAAAARWSPRHAPHPRSAVEPRAEGQPLEDDLLRVPAG